MKVIFLYGPPASGKLTIAKKLAEKTGISLFHNHLTFDLAEVLYEPFTQPFYDYCADLRLDVFGDAKLAHQDLIFTFFYISPDDDNFVNKIIHIAGEDNVKFVKIEASSDTLLDRVENKDRAKYSKINSKSVLTRYLKENNWNESIEKTDSLIISTDNLSPDEAVLKIIEEYDL